MRLSATFVVLALAIACRRSPPVSPPTRAAVTVVPPAKAGEPFVLAEEPSRVLGVFTSDRVIVWRTMDPAGSVWSLRARSWESPAVSTLANGEYASSPMVLAGAYVYWCEEDRIARVSVSGGSVERFASSNGRCASIDGDAQRIVWSTNDGLIHEKAPASHGDAQKVVTLDAGYWSLTLAGDSVIAVDTPRAVRISLAKRTQVALEGLDAPFTIAGNDVYRVDTYLVPGPYNPKNGAYGSNGYAIVRTSLDPAAPRTRLADAQANPSNLQVVGEHLYWTDGGIYEQDVALHRLRLPDGKAEIVVVIPWSSGGHAYDQRRVVWHDGDTHQIKALLH